MQWECALPGNGRNREPDSDDFVTDTPVGAVPTVEWLTFEGGRILKDGEHCARGLLPKGMMKANAALRPVPELGSDILSGKDNPAGAPNPPVVFRIGFGCDEQEERRPIRRSNAQPAVPGRRSWSQTWPRFEPHVEHHLESKLIPIELQALVLIANKDRDTVNAQIQVLPVQPKRGPFRPIPGRRAGHGRDCKP